MDEGIRRADALQCGVVECGSLLFALHNCGVLRAVSPPGRMPKDFDQAVGIPEDFDYVE